MAYLELRAVWLAPSMLNEATVKPVVPKSEGTGGALADVVVEPRASGWRATPPRSTEK